MRTHILSVIIIASIPVFTTGCSQQQVSYSKDIQPILTSSCVQCHTGSGEGSKKSGFSVDDYNSLMQGTKFGPVVVAGDSVSSTLYRLVSHKADPEIHMPPHGELSLAEGRADPLTKEQTEIIKLWIDQGAKNN